jgi:uncharacterized protein
MDIFSVPVGDKILVYAPLHGAAALVNPAAARLLGEGLYAGAEVPAVLQDLLDLLRQPVAPPPLRDGPLNDPFFLGLIPTRGCNMACRYCDFAAPKADSPVMSLDTARRAVDAYLDLLETDRAEVHFFGGEPFYAPEVVHFVVEYTSGRAAERGLLVRFEATTNGLYSRSRAEWIAEHFDTVVLSLDGPAGIQNEHRPVRGGKDSFDIVARSAAVFSGGPVELVIRAAVTDQTARSLPEIAQWVSQTFRPSTVCFESLTPSPLAKAAGMRPPDPWEFAENFVRAAGILKEYGIRAVLSTADLDKTGVSFCPVGKDALIVTPGGTVNACYLLEDDWADSGIEMQIGQLNGGHFQIDMDALANVRGLTVDDRQLCQDCLCRYHCAGGCHIHHDTSGAPGAYDDLCVQTRLITIANLLHKIGQPDLAASWMSNRVWQAAAVLQPVDRWHTNGARL